MRTKNVLINGFEEIKILQQYMYLSEEHTVLVKNSIDVPLEIYMGENYHYYCRNLNFPNLPATNWSEHMTVNTMLAIIKQLKESPARRFPDKFSNGWEEVKSLLEANLILNVDV